MATKSGGRLVFGDFPARLVFVLVTYVTISSVRARNPIGDMYDSCSTTISIAPTPTTPQPTKSPVPECSLQEIGESGEGVVDSVLQTIADSGLFADDKCLFKRIALVESTFGTQQHTYESENCGGIWQVDKDGFKETQTLATNPRLAAKYDKIKSEFGIDWPTVEWGDLADALHSALAARLLLSKILDRIPTDSIGQAQYWERYYRRLGNGSDEMWEQFVEVVEAHEKDHGDCQTAVDTLYPHGDGQGDSMLSSTDDGSTSRLWVEGGIQIYGERYRNFFVNMNGYLTMMANYMNPTPAPPGEQAGDDLVILAPLWVDNEGGHGDTNNDSVVFYQLYTQWSDSHVVNERSMFIMNMATSHIRTYTGGSDFTASNVIIVTWYYVTPYPYDVESGETCSYQLVIISDHALHRTFAMFNYGHCTYEKLRANAIFTMAPTRIGSVDYVINTLPFSGTSHAFRMLSTVGNVGIEGRLLYRLTRNEDEEDRDSSYKCRIWMVEQINNEPSISRWVAALPACPCTIMQAIVDPRFIISFQELCFVSRTQQYTQRCCYDHSRSTRRSIPVRFWNWLLEDLPLLAQPAYSSGSFAWYSEVLSPHSYQTGDAEPKDHCCRQSDLCHIFYTYRPLNTCVGYQPPSMGWIFGDSHFHTVDGFEYTYNAIGEFWLQKPTDPLLEKHFRLQARMSWAWDENGEQAQGSVCVAFAATDYLSARVHIELTEDRKSMVIVADDGERDFTQWYYNPTETDAEIHYRNAFFRRLLDFLYVQFPSGAALRVGVRGQQLDGMLIVDEDYAQPGHSGLLGTFNHDETDDLKMPTGSKVNALPLSSSASDIHKTFGEAYRTKTWESLFWYDAQDEPGQYQNLWFEPTLEPLVWANQSVADADALCRGNRECLYDFYVTNDTELASVSRDVSMGNRDTENLIKNRIPVIQGPTEIHVTVLQEFTTIVTVSDPDAVDTVQLQNTHLPDGATYDMGTGVLTWTPRDMSEVANLEFSAIDSRNASALDLRITVKLCNCSDNGVCDFDHSLPKYNTTDRFQIVYCSCETEWTGLYCEMELDACLVAPCMAHQDCVDISASVHKSTGKGFNCSTCPPGYINERDFKCQDVDECAAGTDDCDPGTTRCVNTHGGFRCSCLPNLVEIYGNDTHCQDFDECSLLLDDCSQLCINAFGGYMCDSYAGYGMDADGRTCKINDSTLATKCQASVPNCEGNCVADGSTVKCECLSGYNLVGTETCEDIDECAVRTDPCGTRGSPLCENIIGSYVCKCMGGFLLGNYRACGECEPGLSWAEECSESCNCASGATCDPVTGCSACRQGWTGNACDLDVDECANNADLCEPFSTCNNTIGSYHCLCEEGFYRSIDTCVGINECEDDIGSQITDSCQNGARCVDQVNGTECVCLPGYTGQSCETNFNECDQRKKQRHLYCENNSVCTDLVNTVDCACVGAFYGRFCQHALTFTPAIQDIFPTYGPEAGGTVLTLRGRNIPNTTLDVYLDDLACDATLGQMDYVVAVTPRLQNQTVVGRRLAISVIVSGGLETRMPSGSIFVYKGNPEITGLHPLEILPHGGIKVTVSGESFDSISQPVMEVSAVKNPEYNHNDSAGTGDVEKIYRVRCSVENSKKMICPSPNIDEHMRPKPRVRRAAEVDPYLFYTSFILDGVEEYNQTNFEDTLPEFSQLIIIPDPPGIEEWEKVVKVKGRELLTIYAKQGDDMTAGCTVSDYTVSIGDGYCEDLDLSTNSLRCYTPRHEPSEGTGDRDGGTLSVILTLGNFEAFIGYVKYEADGVFENPAVLGSVIGGALLLAILAVTCGCVCYIRRRKPRPASRSEGDDPQSATAGHPLIVWARHGHALPSRVARRIDGKGEYLTQGVPQLGYAAARSGGRDGYLEPIPGPGDGGDGYLYPGVSQDGYLAPADHPGYEFEEEGYLTTAAVHRGAGPDVRGGGYIIVD